MSLEYLAGFFDGEGCITISNNGSLCLGVVNTSYPVLQMFVKEFGGIVQDRKQIVNKKQYVWRAYGETAMDTLRKIDIHLVEKQNQAFVAEEWMRVRNQYPTVQSISRGRFANPERAKAIKKYQTKLTNLKLGKHIDD